MSKNLPAAAAKQDRREFLKAGGALTAALLAPAALADTPKTLPGLPSNPRTPAAMPTRNLGKTGYRVGIFSLGGQASIEKPNNFDVAVPIIERALDLGVNYIDTSSIYGGPERWSEQYVGKVMAHRRNEAFLATKTRERSRDGSLRMIEKSLQLLQTDHVDLWQLHDVGIQANVDADLRQRRSNGSSARDAAAKSRALPRRHRPLPARSADGVHPASPLRYHPDGHERGRPASLQLQRAVAAAGRRAPDGHHRHEDPCPRTSTLHLDAAARRASRIQPGRARPSHPARSPFARPCTTRFRARSARSSSAATRLPMWKRMCNWRGSLRR